MDKGERTLLAQVIVTPWGGSWQWDRAPFHLGEPDVGLSWISCHPEPLPSSGRGECEQLNHTHSLVGQTRG